jgi:uncharacterized RDD family membrane protein YckC
VTKRAFITPDFFSVAPGLIGLPLSSPSRRAMAMAIDGILVAILVQAGGVFLGLAAVFVLLRASKRGEKTGYVRTSVQFTLRAIAAIVLFAVIVKAWNEGEERITEQRDPEPAATTGADPENLNLTFPPGEGLAVAASVTGLVRAGDPGEVSENARKLLESAKRAGATDRQIRDARNELVELMGDDDSPANVAALDSVILSIAGQAPPRLSERDSLQELIADLRRDVNRLDERGDNLAEELEEERAKRGVRTLIAGFFDDLGLGFGWAAVYFTAFLAMMQGQTPGKRMLGIRVIRLDGKPIGWWIAFERFGGYAASFSVGLLGFFQILWDRNRQGLHDKACETVVVREHPQAVARS